MSAFVCNRQHIAAIVRHYVLVQKYAKIDAVAAANELMAANVASVNYHYRHNPAAQADAEPPFTEREIQRAPVLTGVSVLKQLQCLDYQSCEVDDWRDSNPRRLMDEIEHATIQALPGYDEAPWGI